MFETRLLVIITAATLLVTALAITLSWFANRRIRGAHYWSLGYFFLAAGVALQAAQNMITPVITIALANVLLSCGVYFTYIGVSQFQGRNVRYRVNLLLLVLFVLVVHALAGLGREGFAARTLLISGLIGMIAFMIGYGFLKSEDQGRSLANRFNVAVYFFLGLAFMARALSIFFIPLQTNAIDNTAFSHATYLGATIFNILIAFSYLFTLYGSDGMVLQRVADTDTLTGLLNRQGVSKHTDLLLKRMQALGGNVSALFFQLQPTLDGEQAQNRLLLGFAEKLLRSFQPTDLVARIGDRQFVVVMANAEKGRLVAAAEYLQHIFQDQGIDNEGRLLYSHLDYVVIDAVRATAGFDELWRRAARMWEFRLNHRSASDLGVALPVD